MFSYFVQSYTPVELHEPLEAAIKSVSGIVQMLLVDQNVAQNKDPVDEMYRSPWGKYTKGLK